MRNLILFGLFILLLLAAQFASAKTVDEVIEKYIRARGGKDKLANLSSIYMEGRKEITGEQSVVKIIKEQGKLSRTEIETGVVNKVELITDKEARTFFPLSSAAAVKIAGEGLALLQTELDIAGPLVDYIAKGHKAELVGKELLEDNPCYKIRLTTNAGYEMMFWVDTVTYLVSQSSAAAIEEQTGTVTETVTLYKNYQEVDGIQFAHTCETRTKGNNATGAGVATHFHTILLNPGIGPEMFLSENQS